MCVCVWCEWQTEADRDRERDLVHVLQLTWLNLSSLWVYNRSQSSLSHLIKGSQAVVSKRTWRNNPPPPSLRGTPHLGLHAGFLTNYSPLWYSDALIHHLQPTGHVMHHQFNIQQLYALPTLYLCVLYLSENKQRLVPLTA